MNETREIGVGREAARDGIGQPDRTSRGSLADGIIVKHSKVALEFDVTYRTAATQTGVIDHE